MADFKFDTKGNIQNRKLLPWWLTTLLAVLGIIAGIFLGSLLS